jgi:hypothetical protein
MMVFDQDHGSIQEASLQYSTSIMAVFNQHPGSIQPAS